MPCSTLYRFVTTTALAAPLMLAMSALAQERDSGAFTGYRIESLDCPAAACGHFRGATQDQIADFLAAETARRARLTPSNAIGTGAGDGASQGLSLGLGNNDTQVVFLDFNAGGPNFLINDLAGFFGVPGAIVALPAHFYTPAEKDMIQARLEADYAQLNYSFTQSPPTSGAFTTLSFACGATDNQGNPAACITLIPTASGTAISILFGRADNIDWRNKNRGDNAFIDANFWTFTTLVDPSGGFFSALTGLPVDANNPLPVQFSKAIVNQSSNTGAHELGHIIGQRHHDSFGAPGDGLPPRATSPQPDDFIPIFPGNTDAGETFLHLMASGASAGLSFSESANADRFFSERATVKNAISERGRLISEAAATDNDGSIRLGQLVAPNPLEEGENADGRLDIKSLVVQGFLDRPGFPGAFNEPETDAYRFHGTAGRFFNAEIISFSDILVANPIIGTLKLFFVENDGTLTQVAENQQTFEPFDPLIFDFELPFDGAYVLEVSAPNIVFFDFTGPGGQPDGIPDPFPLDETGNGSLRTGDYELLVYTVEGAMGNGPNHLPGPGASGGGQ